MLKSRRDSEEEMAFAGNATGTKTEDSLSKTNSSEIVELDVDLSASPYFNPDIAPTGKAGRRWGVRDLAVLWISLSACIPTYTLASSMIEQGMDWKQAIGTILLGNLIVLIPMILNAHPGTKYGIPFPVYCRASFGILGANIPAILRALVACGWFGIQAWIGGAAIHTILAIFFPSWHQQAVGYLGVTQTQLCCFIFFWTLNMIVAYQGIESIRWLLNIKAPILIVLGTALLVWAYFAAEGFGPMLAKPSEFAAGMPKEGKFWWIFFPALTANVGFWATLSLNIPDFSRYAYSQRDQAVGQAIGLPTTMAFFSFIGIAVTSATVVIFGETIWDPVVLIGKFSNPIVLGIAMFSLCLATLATNIAANVVGPANDFAHLNPKWISFRAGGLITGIIGILIQPWRLMADTSGYIFVWLVGYSSLLGAVGGILIADYYLIRRTKLVLPELYQRSGRYWYTGGFNLWALIALVCGVVPCVPGFFAEIAIPSEAIENQYLWNSIGWKFTVTTLWREIYHYAWFVSFGIAMAVYCLLMILERLRNRLDLDEPESDRVGMTS